VRCRLVLSLGPHPCENKSENVSPVSLGPPKIAEIAIIIRDSPVKKVSKVGVRNRIEIFDDVDVYHPPQSLAHDGSMQRVQCLMSRAAGPESV
jgi:hypothetical protein